MFESSISFLKIIQKNIKVITNLIKLNSITEIKSKDNFINGKVKPQENVTNMSTNSALYVSLKILNCDWGLPAVNYLKS